MKTAAKRKTARAGAGAGTRAPPGGARRAPGEAYAAKIKGIARALLAPGTRFVKSGKALVARPAAGR